MQNKDLVKIENKYFKYPQVKYLPRRQADLSKLNAREIKLIDEVLEKLSDMNASEISDYSHKDMPWLAAPEGGVIDYESVLYRQPGRGKNFVLAAAETALSKDWLKTGEDEAWQDL